MTAKQLAAFLAFVKAHPRHRHTPRKAVRPDDTGMEFPAHTYWILGQNDTLETCAMTAIANQLLMDEHARAADAEIAAAGENLSLEAAVEYVKEHGLAGWRIGDAFPVEADFRAVMMPGMLIGLDTPWGSHAVVTSGGGMAVSWGRILRIKPPMKVQEAWYVDWAMPEGGMNGRQRLRSVRT